jgi:hypothetical protein
LDLRAAWIREMKDSSEIEFIKVDGKENVADFFTKILPPGEHKSAVGCLMHVAIDQGACVDLMSAGERHEEGKDSEGN